MDFLQLHSIERKFFLPYECVRNFLNGFKKIAHILDFYFYDSKKWKYVTNIVWQVSTMLSYIVYFHT